MLAPFHLAATFHPGAGRRRDGSFRRGLLPAGAIPGFLLLVLASLAAGPALAGPATVPGAITSYVTIQSAGFEWRITGDDDRDCAVALEYRRAGETAWRPAQPLLRVETGLWIHGEDPGNLLAGSLFYLEPLTTYEARLTLSDPDGGSAQQVVTVTTHGEPRAAADSRVRYVQPGSGGGTGTQADPFRGLAAADAAAQPGDVFIVTPGTYTTKFVPTRDGTAARPIVYHGLDAATAILDGNGGTTSVSNCVDLSNHRYVFLENLTLRNCLRPLVAHATTGVVIRGCTIEPVHQLLNAMGLIGLNLQGLHFADNTVLMPGDWEGIGRTGSYGVGGYGMYVTGNDIVVCYNRFFESWDAMNVGGSDGTGPRTFNCDIHNNLVDRSSDDAIQTDAIHANVRIYRNRIVNCGCAFSFQPCFGGPGYMLHNEVFNSRIETFKYHPDLSFFPEAQVTSGMVALQNTCVSSVSGWYSSGPWRNVRHRNNLLLGARTLSYSLYIYEGVLGDLDYDGYNRQQTYFTKYNNVKYSTFPALYTGAGQEQHAVEVSLADFALGLWPVHPEYTASQGYGAPHSPADYDLQLATGSVAVDKGQVLPNVNDGFVGAAPDLGCYERGAAVPAYGPRAAVVSLDAPEAPALAGTGVQLSAPRPNPMTSATSCALRLDRPATVAARIVDAAGRVVWSDGKGGERAAGTHTLRWDGRDGTGRPASSGVYFLQVRAGSESLTRRIVLLH